MAKASPKKSSPKKSSPKKSSPKKSAPKKSSPKKAASKKAASKKTVAASKKASLGPVPVTVVYPKKSSPKKSKAAAKGKGRKKGAKKSSPAQERSIKDFQVNRVDTALRTHLKKGQRLSARTAEHVSATLQLILAEILSRAIKHLHERPNGNRVNLHDVSRAIASDEAIATVVGNQDGQFVLHAGKRRPRRSRT